MHRKQDVPKSTLMIDRYYQTNQTPWPLNNIQKRYRSELARAIDQGELKTKARTACLCGCVDTQPLTSIDRFGLPFGTHLCRTCGLLYTSPFIAVESLAAYYDKFYHPLTFGQISPQDALFAKGQGHKIFKKLKPHLKRRDIRVFEMGAGTGSNLVEFAQAASRHGYATDLYGTEFNESYVEYGRSKGICLFCQALSEFVKQRNETYDIIILSHVLEHLPDMETQVSLLKTMASQTTLFYIEVPGILQLHRNTVYAADLLRYLTHAHTFHFNLKSLQATLARHRLELLSGNESVESVFRITEDDPTERVDASGNYQTILRYIEYLEANRDAIARRNRSLLNRAIRKIRQSLRYCVSVISM